MSHFSKTFRSIIRGDRDTNLRFADLRQVLLRLGFDERIRGGHHIFTRADSAEIINIQSARGKAKPYQVKQVRDIILENGLGPDEEDNDERSGEEDE